MGKGDVGRAEALGPADAGAVVSVLCESFADYPVMRFVLGPEADYSARLERLITFFVMARVFRGESLLGVRGPDGLQAAALVSDPAGGASLPALGTLRGETWDSLGSEARSRYEAFGETASRFSIDARHIHLNMVGVRRSKQGRGLGRLLLDAVHDLSDADAASTGVSLSTEVRSNVSLYEHFGYEVIGSAPVASTFTTWTMFRRNG